MKSTLLVSTIFISLLWSQFSWGQRVYLFGIPLGDYGPAISQDAPVVQSSWNSNWNSPYIKLNPLKFTNRAECAADSERPANGTFLLLDTYTVAMAAYRYGQSTHNDPRLYSQMAVSRFRWAYVRLVQLIANSLAEGKLPLLPSSNKINWGQGYLKAIEGCEEDCEGLDIYLQKIWNKFEARKYNYDDIDNLKKMNSKSDFVSNGVKGMSCYQLLKVSPFQAQFKRQNITAPFFDELVKAHRNQEEYLVECNELAPVDSLDGYTFQLEMLGLKDEIWAKYGFDFWHSLKTYFSWAWRNSKQMKDYFSPFNHLMKSLELESMSFMLPNSCKSLTRPSCDPSYFSTQMLKEVTRKDFDLAATSFDFSLIYPKGAETQLLDNKLPDVNNDRLSWDNFSNMTDWLANFRKNLTKTRGVLKSRIIKASNFLTLNQFHLTTEKIIQDIKSRVTQNTLPQVNFKNVNYDLQNQLYFMCTEFMVAGDKQFGFFKKDLDLLSETKDFDHALKNITPFKTRDFYSFYQKLAPGVIELCKQLEKEDYFKNIQLDRSGHKEWFRQRFLTEYKDLGAMKEDSGIFLDEPLLALTSFDSSRTTSDVLCLTGIDCAREILSSLFSLYGVGLYQSLILPGRTANSNSLSNPYAERVSCGVYDPSWGAKRAVVNLLGNTLLGFASTAIAAPIYLDIDIAPGVLTSFDRLVEDGKLVFHPNVDQPKLLASLGVEFGPLLGAKCALTITNKGETIQMSGGPNSNLLFTGITVGACLQNKQKVSVAQGQGDITPTVDQNISGCASCFINFETISDQALSLPQVDQNFSKMAYPVIRGLYRFLQVMQDPQDISRSQFVDVNKTYESVRKFGQIPWGCDGLLSSGRSCLSQDDNFIAEYFQWNYGVEVLSYQLKGDSLSVDVDGCHYPLFVDSFSRFKSLALNGGPTRDFLKGLGTCRWGGMK